MDLVQRFLAYAAAFEQTYADDDWSRLEPYFTDDAVYVVTGGPPLGGRFEGRDAVLAQLKSAVDDLDRRFEDRRVAIEGELETLPDGLRFGWRATYHQAGREELVFGGFERAVFEGDRMKLLEDEMEPGSDARIQAWLAAQGDGSADRGGPGA